jgi:hypothetical protein
MRRIGVLINPAADDPDSSAYVAAFARGLQDLGWIELRCTLSVNGRAKRT